MAHAQRIESIARILAVLFVVFIAAAMLDVPIVGQSITNIHIDLSLQLMFAALLVGTVLAAWYWPVLGGFLFIMLGLLYVLLSWGRVPGATQLVLSLPAVVIGGLFISTAYRPYHNEA